MCTALLVEDHPVIRGTLVEFLNDVVGVKVIGAVTTGEEALPLCDTAKPDLAVIDVSLPGMNGIDLVGELKKRHPDLICLMLSGHHELGYVRRALANRAQGYVLKDDPGELTQAIQQVIAGETYLSGPILRKLRAAERTTQSIS